MELPKFCRGRGEERGKGKGEEGKGGWGKGKGEEGKRGAGERKGVRREGDGRIRGKGKERGRADRDRKDSGNHGSNQNGLFMHAFCHNIMRLTYQYLVSASYYLLQPPKC